MVNIQDFEITSIAYDPAVVMRTDAKTIISFDSPEVAAVIKPIRYLIIDFPADIWGAMLKNSQDLGLTTKLITMDDDPNDPG